jgi:aerobic C4-dicarboxylate transport protein
VAGQRFYWTVYGQALLATAVGVLVGHFWPAAGAAMKPLGDGFIKLVRMIVAPIIFCTVVVCIAGAGDMKTVGRSGLIALVYFEAVSTLALIIGLLVVNLVQPGRGMNVYAATIDARAVAQYATGGRAQTPPGFVLDLIPRARWTRSRRGTSFRCCCSRCYSGSPFGRPVRFRWRAWR